MKAYTDIKQSKKLSEILPIESADMSWVEKGNAKRTWYDAENRRITTKYEKKYYFPCWSLAALLEQLDDEITDENGNDYNLTIVKEDFQYQLYYHDSWSRVEDIETNYYDDAVDACVEMIIKLKEKNLL